MVSPRLLMQVKGLWSQIRNYGTPMALDPLLLTGLTAWDGTPGRRDRKPDYIRDYIYCATLSDQLSQSESSVMPITSNGLLKGLCMVCMWGIIALIRPRHLCVREAGRSRNNVEWSIT